ncbi:hypothetical protein [Streptomyces halobius]|uniref:DMSO/TMAO reductase YedYZ heme-binding membrane subunit n=1 Tax=Streptomyces halobius TaxID=2879846 RepID=A0ABY4MCR0_9ACTN|nr:hypothetical protein [Streptomyces halobius]UQA95223.1 hypothetical protein K9S39_28230 [Streptomyces halobius]
MLRPALPAALLLFLAVTLHSGAMNTTMVFLDFGAGVLALVSLSVTVLWGLAATDRMVLHTGHRLLAQAVHRGTGVAGLGFLGLHIWVKVAEGHTGALSAAVPFTDGARPVLIGLGTLAAYVFLAVAVTGAVRGAFAGNTASRWWRALHMSAYVAWAMALVHGLKAGREAAGWATAGYVICLVAVAVRLVLRLHMPGWSLRLGGAGKSLWPRGARRDPGVRRDPGEHRDSGVRRGPGEHRDSGVRRDPGVRR